MYVLQSYLVIWDQDLNRKMGTVCTADEVSTHNQVVWNMRAVLQDLPRKSEMKGSQAGFVMLFLTNQETIIRKQMNIS